MNIAIKKTEKGFVVTFEHGKRFLIPAKKWVEWECAKIMEWRKNYPMEAARMFESCKTDEDAAALAKSHAESGYENLSNPLVEDMHDFFTHCSWGEFEPIEIEPLQVTIEDLWCEGELIDDKES